MAIGWILGGIFAFMTIVYIAIALIAPEWVGIQGKMARKIEESHRHQENSQDQDPDKNKEG